MSTQRGAIFVCGLTGLSGRQSVRDRSLIELD